MSFGDRLGLAGVVLAFFAIAAPYLWPDKKWIGWVSLSCAIVLMFLWGWRELGAELPKLRTRYPTVSTAGVFVVGGCLAVALWRLVIPTVADQSQSTDEKMASSVVLNAALGPSDPYPENMPFAGIIWHGFYRDVRLDIVNGPADVRDVDFLVQLDTSIAGIGQVTQFPNIMFFPAKDSPQLWVSGANLDGTPVSMPVVPVPGAMQTAPVYRVHCNSLLANTSVHLTIASVVLNQAISGKMPDKLFGERRSPKQIRAKGTYSTADGKNYPLELSYTFPDSSVPAQSSVLQASHPRSKAKPDVGAEFNELQKVVNPDTQSPKQQLLAERGFHETVQKYFIMLGENGLSGSATVEGLKTGVKPFEGFPIRVFAKETDNDLHYEITVWQGVRAIVVTDNEFSLPVPHLDRNYDNRALEIVDDNQGPILQVIWKTPSQLVINGIFPMQGNKVYIADDKGFRPWRGERIKPLFKYPSRRFQGQYAD